MNAFFISFYQPCITSMFTLHCQSLLITFFFQVQHVFLFEVQNQATSEPIHAIIQWNSACCKFMYSKSMMTTFWWYNKC